MSIISITVKIFYTEIYSKLYVWSYINSCYRISSNDNFIKFNSILVCLRANLTAQRTIAKWARGKKRSKIKNKATYLIWIIIIIIIIIIITIQLTHQIVNYNHRLNQGKRVKNNKADDHEEVSDRFHSRSHYTGGWHTVLWYMIIWAQIRVRNTTWSTTFLSYHWECNL
jgi:hypothetical protein